MSNSVKFSDLPRAMLYIRSRDGINASTVRKHSSLYVGYVPGGGQIGHIPEQARDLRLNAERISQIAELSGYAAVVLTTFSNGIPEEPFEEFSKPNNMWSAMGAECLGGGYRGRELWEKLLRVEPVLLVKPVDQLYPAMPTMAKPELSTAMAIKLNRDVLNEAVNAFKKTVNYFDPGANSDQRSYCLLYEVAIRDGLNRTAGFIPQAHMEENYNKLNDKFDTWMWLTVQKARLFKRFRTQKQVRQATDYERYPYGLVTLP